VLQAKWIVSAYDCISQNPHIATNVFKEAGIIEVIEEADLEQEGPFADLNQAQDHEKDKDLFTDMDQED